jgi:hypothetical protein
MVKQVESGTVLIMKGRTFELVWTDETEGFNPCHHCALYKEFCVPRRGVTFVDLCTDMQKESNTYFVERKQESASPSIVNKITLSVGRKNGKLVLSNGKSSEWKMTGVDEKTAIASLVYFSIFSRFDQLSCFSSDFKIDVSLCESIKDKSDND